MPDPAKLSTLKLTTRTRKEMAVAVPQCWRLLRRAGFRRRSLIVAFVQAWRRGDLVIDPLMKPTPAAPRTLVSRPKRP